jgi:hypothetical protein
MAHPIGQGQATHPRSALINFEHNIIEGNKTKLIALHN